MREKQMISMNSVVVRNPDVVHTQIDDDLVAMSVEKGMYYGFNEISKIIFELMDEPVSVSSICEKMMQVYEVDRESCEADVLALLKEMQEENLIRVQHA